MLEVAYVGLTEVASALVRIVLGVLFAQRQRIYHAHPAHVSSKKAIKKVYTSTRDRFLNSLRHRQSQIHIEWTEENYARWDEFAVEDHSYIATAAERTRRENTGVFVLNSSGPNGLMNWREDDQESNGIKRATFPRVWQN